MRAKRLGHGKKGFQLESNRINEGEVNNNTVQNQHYGPKCLSEYKGGHGRVELRTTRKDTFLYLYHRKSAKGGIESRVAAEKASLHGACA